MRAVFGLILSVGCVVSSALERAQSSSGKGRRALLPSLAGRNPRLVRPPLTYTHTFSSRTHSASGPPNRGRTPWTRELFHELEDFPELLALRLLEQLKEDHLRGRQAHARISHLLQPGLLVLGGP